MELKVTNLTKEFEHRAAVDHVSFSFGTGIYGLLGVNGAGKTTFMRMLCTLLEPSSGEVTWEGRDIFRMDGAYRKLLGYLPQEFGFYPDFTVWDYLMYIASIKGIRPGAAKKRIAYLLHQVGLERERGKKMKKLSGGMKRRVGIAQAMLNDPKILILDEPTAGLDPGERIRLRNLLGEVSRDRMVLLSTHIVSDVEYVANEILLMKDGRIVHAGTRAEILSEAPTRVWSLNVRPEEVKIWQRQYRVSSLQNLPRGTNLRLLSGERPDRNAKEEELTLEDVFLHYFEERADADYDTL